VDQYIQGNFFEHALRGQCVSVSTCTAALTVGPATLSAVATFVAAADVARGSDSASVVIQNIPAVVTLDNVLRVSGVLGIGSNVESAYHHFMMLVHFVAPLTSDFAHQVQKIAERIL